MPWPAANDFLLVSQMTVTGQLYTCPSALFHSLRVGKKCRFSQMPG